MKAKPQANVFVCGSIFDLIFLGKNSETILIAVEKVGRKKNWWVKLTTYKKHGKTRFYSTILLSPWQGLGEMLACSSKKVEL